MTKLITIGAPIAVATVVACAAGPIMRSARWSPAEIETLRTDRERTFRSARRSELNQDGDTQPWPPRPDHALHGVAWTIGYGCGKVPERKLTPFR